MHYYQFNIGDYAGHTRHLTLLEDLAYRRLLDLYYLHERPLSQDAAIVAKQVGMRDDAATVRDVLNEFFEKTDDGYVNARADREIANYHSRIEQASKAGKASAERRFNDRSTTVQPTNNQEPITNNQEYIDRFDSFWKHYPRKVAKPNALKAWVRLKPDDALTEKIIASIKSQKLSDREIQFVPHPATWLNARRWEDEVSSTPNVNNQLGRRVL